MLFIYIYLYLKMIFFYLNNINKNVIRIIITINYGKSFI